MKLTKMKIRPFLELLAFSGIALLGCFSIVQAQQGSISISPASIDAKVKRGTSYTQNFTLTNNTDNRLRFHCSLTDFWYDENNNRLTGRPGTLPRSASAWIQFSPADVIIAPNSTATVKAVITIPQGVSASIQ